MVPGRDESCKTAPCMRPSESKRFLAGFLCILPRLAYDFSPGGEGLQQTHCTFAIPLPRARPTESVNWCRFGSGGITAYAATSQTEESDPSDPSRTDQESHERDPCIRPSLRCSFPGIRATAQTPFAHCLLIFSTNTAFHRRHFPFLTNFDH